MLVVLETLAQTTEAFSPIEIWLVGCNPLSGLFDLHLVLAEDVS
jgi:hypothetical protein